MNIVNTNQKCKGTWTREENGNKSILDYVLADNELSSYIQEMKIHDDSKEISPFHLKKEKQGKIRTTYSDHNPITLKTNLVMMKAFTEEEKKKKVITEDGREKYCKEIQRLQISQIWDEEGCMQEKYDKWEEIVMKTRRKFEKTRKKHKKRKSKTMRKLLKKKRKLRGELKSGKDEEKYSELTKIKEKIVREEEESYFRKLKKTCEEIRIEGKFSSGGFWKLIKRMKNKKSENPHAVRNKEGEMLTDKEQIIKRYGEYFEELLTTTNEKTKLPENKQIVEKIETQFEEIMEKAKQQEPKKTEEEVMSKIINGMKRGKAKDICEWNNEMIREGGEEMVRSLVKMADEIKKELEVPNQ